MSMREFIQAEEKQQAEEAAKRAHDARVKELSIHPLVKAGCDRNVREAYFCGLAYAGVCDDFAIDETERNLLTTIGNALSLAPEFISEMMARFSAVQSDDAAKRWAMSLFTESLNALCNLSSVWMPRLFAAEFARIRLVHPGNESELAADFRDIGEGLGSPVSDAQEAIAAVLKGGAVDSMKSIDSLAVLLGDEVAKYFVLRDMDLVDEPLAKFRLLRAFRIMSEIKREEARRTLPDRLVAVVESDDTWPMEFNPADYKPLFDEAGIVEADVGPFVAVKLLPHMKRACEAARKQVKMVPVVYRAVHNGAKFKDVKEFRILFRYAYFIDAHIDLNEIYSRFYFIGLGQRMDESSYYLAHFNSDDYTARKIGHERWGHCSFYQFSYSNELFDRLSCHRSGIWKKDEARYFAQWEGLFEAIEERFPAKLT